MSPLGFIYSPTTLSDQAIQMKRIQVSLFSTASVRLHDWLLPGIRGLEPDIYKTTSKTNAEQDKSVSFQAPSLYLSLLPYRLLLSAIKEQAAGLSI